MNCLTFLKIMSTGLAEQATQVTQGEAISLVCVDEHKFLRDIESLLKQKINNVVIQGFEPNPAIKAQPILLGRGQQFRGGGAGGGGGAKKWPPKIRWHALIPWQTAVFQPF